MHVLAVLGGISLVLADTSLPMLHLSAWQGSLKYFKQLVVWCEYTDLQTTIVEASTIVVCKSVYSLQILIRFANSTFICRMSIDTSPLFTVIVIFHWYEVTNA